MHLCFSKTVLNRCIPENIYALGTDVIYSIYAYLNSFDGIKQTVADLMAAWREMLMMTGFALVTSFITVCMIHFMAAVVSWIILFVVSISMLLVTAIMWWIFIDLKYKLDSLPEITLLDENVRNENTFLVLAIVTTILTVIILLICLVMRKRVKLVVALFYEAGACLRAMPGLLMQPVWTFLALMIFLAFWLTVLLALATADYPKKEESVHLALSARRPTITADAVTFGQADIPTLTWIDFSNPSWVRYMWWFHLM